MALLIRAVVAILAGVIVTSLLNYFGLLTTQLNGLIGFLIALAVFFSYDGRYPGRPVV